MRTGISITLTPSDWQRLEAAISNRNTAQKHVWRAAIVLLSADGVGTAEIMRQTGTSKTCVWRWQERFIQEGVDGLLRDETRPSRIKPLGPDVTERVVRLTLADPPAEATHWTAAMMVQHTGISASAVRRIWRAHGLLPHRYRQFKLSNDPKFAEKLRDVVGLYADPPAHALVLSVDEKSQIQALTGHKHQVEFRLAICDQTEEPEHLAIMFSQHHMIPHNLMGGNDVPVEHAAVLALVGTLDAAIGEHALEIATADREL